MESYVGELDFDYFVLLPLQLQKFTGLTEHRFQLPTTRALRGYTAILSG